ncbi:13803_t:CDS:1, partial [Cetraspora pellucida]
MCDKNTKQLVTKLLLLQLPEIYFDIYCNANHDYYIDKREIVYIVKKNDDKVLAIFLKCVLKKYLKDNEMKHRFNTCPCCGKLKFCFIEKINSFGHENGYEQELYQETLNPCDVYNSPYTNHVGDRKFNMRFLDHDDLVQFFKKYSISRKFEIYFCKHKNYTVYFKNSNKVEKVYKEED